MDKITAFFGPRRCLTTTLVLCFGLCVWVWVHQPLLSFGTNEVPLHKTHIGDEQSPVNAALHMLKDLNPLSIRESGTYYGPIMATLSVPAAVVDFGWRVATDQVSTKEQYQNLLVWDWGGVLYFSRLVAVLVGFLGLWALYLLVREIDDGPSRTNAILATLLLATNLIYFEYAAFFRAWIFIVSALLWQLYLTVLIARGKITTNRGFVISAFVGVFSFGLNYLTVLFQIFLAPYFFVWLKEFNKKLLVGLVYYTVTYVIGSALIIAWYPEPFYRILHIGAEGQEMTVHSSSVLSTVATTAVYYGELFVVNNLPLLLIVLIAAVFLRRSFSSEKRLLLAAITLTGVAHAVLMLSVGWTYGRYVLPVMVCLVAVVSIIVSSNTWQDRFGVRGAFLRQLVIGLVVVQITFGMIGALTTARLYAIEPSEVSVIKALDPESVIVVIRSRYYGLTELVGVPHTKETYEFYFSSLGLEKLEYYQYLINTQPPQGQDVYTIYYTNFDTLKLPESVLNKADHFVYCSNPLWENLSRPDPFNTNFFRSYYPQWLREDCVLLR